MTQSQNTIQRLASAGIEALRKGDAAAARGHFEKALQQQATDPSIWLGLAFTCAQLGDQHGALNAVNRALSLEPHNLRALLFKGDHLTQSGQSRKALAAYQGALRLAARQSSISQDVQAGLARAEQRCQQFAVDYQQYLRAELAEQGYRQGHPRFDEALNIAFGAHEPYLQQPTRFYYPGLAPTTFFDSAQFPWIKELEAQTRNIRSELDALLAGNSAFTPYLVSNPDAVPLNDTSNLDNDDWGAYYFYQQGVPVTAHTDACPDTFAAVQLAPLPRVPGSTPHALFSKLAANTRIPPHHGLINTRLICHLPILVPAHCGALRCGGSQRPWHEGEALVFDDTIEHEAWNNSAQDRVVLLFDIWRPELSEAERQLITTMLSAVQRYESGSD